MTDSLFAPPLSKSSMVYLLVRNPPLHTPYISSLILCLLFAAHAHIIVTCFAVVLILCHLLIVSLSTLYLELYLLPYRHTSIWPFSSLPAEVPPHFPFLLHTQLLYRLPLIINDTSILVSNGTKGLNLCHPIRILASTAASASPSANSKTCPQIQGRKVRKMKYDSLQPVSPLQELTCHIGPHSVNYHLAEQRWHPHLYCNQLKLVLDLETLEGCKDELT